MATRLITEGDFRSSRYGQLADQIDGRLSDIIEQAESYVESVVDRTLSRETHVEIAEKGRESVFLRHSPVISVSTVEYRSTHSDTWSPVNPSTYRVLEDLGIIEFDRRLDSGDYRVTYDAGYDPIPAVIKAAVILQTAFFAYQDFEIYGSGDAKEPGINYIERQVDKYLRPFVRKKLV